MKKLAVGLLTLALMLTACAPPTPAEQPPVTVEQPTQGANEMTPVQIAALSHLSATLNLPTNQIALVSTEAVTWSDGCLGVQRPNVMCTQALVEGFKITFDANGREYELHTNETGSSIVIASGLDVNSLIEDVLIAQLAENLGLEADNITVLSNEPAEFSDACLGVVMQDLMCAEVITPGRIVVLESEGVQYEYHISEDGTRIQPATLALTWSRDGGIAGFCDRLTVFLSGEVYGTQCKSGDGRTKTFANLFSVTEQKQFMAWVTKYGQVDLDASDPKGVADGMTVLLSLYGNGTTAQPSDDDRVEVFLWAQNLYQKLYR